MNVRSDGLQLVEQIQHSYGTGFEGCIQMALGNVVVTSYSYIQIAFHHPSLLFRRKIKIDHWKFFGSDAFLEEPIFRDLIKLLSGYPDIRFFLRICKDRWWLDLDGIHEGGVVNDVQMICEKLNYDVKVW